MMDCVVILWLLDCVILYDWLLHCVYLPAGMLLGDVNNCVVVIVDTLNDFVFGITLRCR